jgi:hypothetical protein
MVADVTEAVFQWVSHIVLIDNNAHSIKVKGGGGERKKDYQLTSSLFFFSGWGSFI